MFFCEACRQRLHWPPTLGIKSDGPCECCGAVAVCHDVPSALLVDHAAYVAREQAMRAEGMGPALDAIRRDDPAAEALVEAWAAAR